MEPWFYIILVVAGVVAGFLNVMAGGGSTLTVPLLIFMGLDPQGANGTNRVAILVQNIAAVISFRQEKYSEFRTSLKMAFFTLPGGLAGAFIAINTPDDVFKIILALVIIGVMLTVAFPSFTKKLKSAGTQGKHDLIYLVMFLIGFYGGFIQVGVGFIIMAAIHLTLHQTLVRVNMHKVFIVLLYTIPALLVFIISGNIDYMTGLFLAAGNATGGWIAAKVSVKKGEGVIRVVLMIALLIMSLKLIGLF